MTSTKAIPSTTFDHVLWLIQSGDGAWQQAQILPGSCLLLFTSLDNLHDFVAGCDDVEGASLQPVVFSRNRKEFGRQARLAARAGTVGALIDPPPGSGEAPFLRFARLETEP